MDLQPSKLSSAASRVWSESAGQFQHKKTDLNIDLGLQKITATNGADNSNLAEKASTSISSGYVFGSRVFERVTKGDDRTKDDAKDSFSPSTTANAKTSNGSKEAPKLFDVSSIFRRVTQKTAEGASTSDSVNMWRTGPSANGGSKNMEEPHKDQLSESANELACKNEGSQQTATNEQHIMTGEEEEQNLLQVSCKFYQYNMESKKWQERGMGTLRLNRHRASRDYVRLVGRQSGSQRVLINSKVFPEMLLEELSEKRVKISALTGDSDIPQLFLIQASPASIASLQNLLRTYIDASGITKAMAANSTSRKRRLTDEGDDGAEKGLDAEGTKKFVAEKQPDDDEDADEEEQAEEKTKQEANEEQAEEKTEQHEEDVAGQE